MTSGGARSGAGRKPKPPGEHYKTPARTIRIDDDTWLAWQAYAAAQGMSVSELIRQAVQEKILQGKQKNTCILASKQYIL